MNSVRSMERALNFEIARQTKAIENGEPIVQETRHWDEDAGATKSMRSKEEAFDYRYFPEPDIPPIEPADAWIGEIRTTLPELPRAGASDTRPSSDSSPRSRASWSPTARRPSCSSARSRWASTRRRRRTGSRRTSPVC